ncbi:MAG: hypothetical protein RMK80_06315 [Pseudobdellovibrionaceae bacterium]|nr:hypothetical protein [Pseudobdellovibrionaceae bacterium]
MNVHKYGSGFKNLLRIGAQGLLILSIVLGWFDQSIVLGTVSKSSFQSREAVFSVKEALGSWSSAQQQKWDPAQLLHQLKDFKKNEGRLLRGELSEPEIRTRLQEIIQMRTQHLRKTLENRPFSCVQFQEEVGIWIYFLGEVSFAEADYAVQRWVIEQRLSLLDLVAFAVNHSQWNKQCVAVEAVRWWESLRFPWPVDRILLENSRGTALLPKERYWIQQLILGLTQNEELTASQFFMEKQVLVSPNLEKLTRFFDKDFVQWRKREKEERHKIQSILLRYASET